MHFLIKKDKRYLRYINDYVGVAVLLHADGKIFTTDWSEVKIDNGDFLFLNNRHKGEIIYNLTNDTAISREAEIGIMIRPFESFYLENLPLIRKIDGVPPIIPTHQKIQIPVLFKADDVLLFNCENVMVSQCYIPTKDILKNISKYNFLLNIDKLNKIMEVLLCATKS